MPTVYVVQDDGRKNLTPALKFGEIKVLATRDLILFGNPSHTIKSIQSQLQDFDATQDFLVPAGDPILIGIAFHEVAYLCNTVPCLKWDRQTNDYFPIRIDL